MTNSTRALVLSFGALALGGCPGPSTLDDAAASDAAADAAGDAAAADAPSGIDAFMATTPDAAGDVDAAADDAAVLLDAAASLDALSPPDAFTPPDAFVPPDAFRSSDAAADAGPPPCPALGSRTIVDVPPGVLAGGADVRWTCNNLYILNGIVVVEGSESLPQTLSIEPGTVVQGLTADGSKGFLVVTRDGRLEARGTADRPIVFTSADPVGMRARDDWGGITLLGRAFAGATRRAEGFPLTLPGGESLDGHLAYGPRPGGTADDAWSCGTLEYVRVEFASFNAGGGAGNESNAIQIYSCGWGTTIDHVQTHLSGDDGMEIFGGTVDVKHLVLTGASDDTFDWDDGWRGRAQFIAGQQHRDAADLGFEAGGSSDSPSFAPNPRIFNVTFVGSNGMAGQFAGRLRGASRGFLRNAIFVGFTDGFLDIGGAAAAANLQATPPTLSVRNTIFDQAAAAIAWPTGSDDAADGTPALIESDFLTAAIQLNQVTSAMLVDPFDQLAPDWRPASGAPIGADRAVGPSEEDFDTRPPFFDVSADYVGAFAPGGVDWTAGWTAYPAS
jgi:hypothetical protein